MIMVTVRNAHKRFRSARNERAEKLFDVRTVVQIQPRGNSAVNTVIHENILYPSARVDYERAFVHEFVQSMAAFKHARRLYFYVENIAAVRRRDVESVRPQNSDVLHYNLTGNFEFFRERIRGNGAVRVAYKTQNFSSSFARLHFTQPDGDF